MINDRKQHLQITYNSPVVLTFSLVCVAVWALGIAFPHWKMLYFAASPSISFSHPRTLLGLLTHCLGHANWNHLLSNLMFILLLGPLVEEKYGSVTLLLLIACTAVVTGLCNALFFDTGLMGASGVVFMFIMLGATANSRQGELPLTFLLVALLFLGQEVLSIFNEDSISQSAHLIGGLCGGIFGFSFRKHTETVTSS